MDLSLLEQAAQDVYEKNVDVVNVKEEIEVNVMHQLYSAEMVTVIKLY